MVHENIKVIYFFSRVGRMQVSVIKMRFAVMAAPVKESCVRMCNGIEQHVHASVRDVGAECIGRENCRSSTAV